MPTDDIDEFHQHEDECITDVIEDSFISQERINLVTWFETIG